MAKLFSKIQVPTGVVSRNEFPMSNMHVTTHTFMRLGVGTYYQAAPGTKFSYKLSSFTRLNPLSHPVYGSATVKHKLFFVPLKSIFPAWNEFINRTVHNYDSVTAIPTLVPYVWMSDLIMAIIGGSNAHPSGYNGAYDFDHGGYKYSFSTYGKFVYNLLVQLGIHPDFTMPKNADYNMPITKLLCLARIYCDYFMNATYLHSDVVYNRVMQKFKNNAAGNERYDLTDINSIFTMLWRFYYPNDYFVSAFDNPVGPLNAHEGANISIKDNTIPSYQDSDKSRVGVTTENTPVINAADNNSPNVVSLSQYISNALNKLTQYFQRHQFVGSRSAERHLAEWGLSLSEGNEKAIYIDGLEYDIMFGDVMSNADTGGASLGAYAGKGIGAGEKQFESKSFNDFGYYIEVNYIVPKVGYCQGSSKDSFHQNLLDFFTPDFDNLGMDAVKSAELFVPKKSLFSDGQPVNWSPLHDHVFGFQPRYIEYKHKLDTLSGDFMCDSINAGMDGWHLFRLFSNDSFRTVNSPELHPVHSQTFTRNEDSSQYSRIFATSKIDNFIMNFRYNYSVSAPMKSSYDMLNFDDIKNKITMALEGQRDS